MPGSKRSRAGAKRAKRARPMKSGDPLRDNIAARRGQAELKMFQVNAFNTSYFNSEAGSIKVDLTAVTQGNSGAQRVGDHLYASDLRLWFFVFNGLGATANGTNITRVFVVQYSQDNGRAVPLIADFLTSTNANGGVNTYGALSGMDVDYDRGYTILWDSGLILTYGSNGLAQTADCFFNHHVKEVVIPLSKLRDRNIRYTTGANTGYGHIFLVVVGDQATTGVNPSFSYTSQFRFSDA